MDIPTESIEGGVGIGSAVKRRGRRSEPKKAVPAQVEKRLADGRLVYQCHLLNGKKHGQETKYYMYPCGCGEAAYTEIGNFWKGLRNGPLRVYDKKKRLFIEAFYIQGIQTGLRRTFFDDTEENQLGIQGLYIGGELEGTLERYDRHGNVFHREKHSFGLYNFELRTGYIYADDESHFGSEYDTTPESSDTEAEAE